VTKSHSELEDGEEYWARACGHELYCSGAQK